MWIEDSIPCLYWNLMVNSLFTVETYPFWNNRSSLLLGLFLLQSCSQLENIIIYLKYSKQISGLESTEYLTVMSFILWIYVKISLTQHSSLQIHLPRINLGKFIPIHIFKSLNIKFNQNMFENSKWCDYIRRIKGRKKTLKHGV